MVESITTNIRMPTNMGNENLPPNLVSSGERSEKPTNVRRRTLKGKSKGKAKASVSAPAG